MATTIRVEDTDKQQLEYLQAKILLETGEKLSYTEIIHFLIRLCQSKGFEDLIQEIKPLKEIDWSIHEKLIEDWGIGSSDDIDDVAYGD